MFCMLYALCPKQLGGVECGYYVKRYMHDIILFNNTSILDVIHIKLQTISSKILVLYVNIDFLVYR